MANSTKLSKNSQHILHRVMSMLIMMMMVMKMKKQKKIRFQILVKKTRRGENKEARKRTLIVMCANFATNSF